MSNKQVLIYPMVAILALGAALYQALDMSGFKNMSRSSFAAATVNGTVIPAAEYTRALEAMQAGLERPLNKDDKERALKILIDEELIVQEAIRLNLASDDRLVRKNLAQALIRSVVALDTPVSVSDAELEAFYIQEQSLFKEPLIVTLKVLKVVTPDTEKKFIEALEAGSSFYGAGEAAGFSEQKIPQKIPIGKVGDLLGGKARDSIIGRGSGDIIGPVDSSGNTLYIWLLDTQGGQLTFAKAKKNVAIEYQRRQEEHALQKYLARLRKQARIKK